MLTEKEFELIKEIAFSKGQLTQRELAETMGYSLGTINKICSSCISEGLMDTDYKLLQAGRDELEKFRVKNAIILAAGATSDTNPIAKNIPKGLYVVKGEVLIERLIKQLQEAGIENIYVVVGFRMDQFFYLEEKYGVKLIPNTSYQTRNNNGSLYCVKEFLGNSYIIPNDEYFAENVFKQYEYKSYYAAVYTEKATKEAYLKLDDSDRILRVYKGGDDGWVMLGHSYLSADFAEEYIKWLEDVYDLYETKRLFWEEIFYPHLRETTLYAKKYEQSIIYEFDELSELQGFDDQFFNNINPEIYKLICEIFNSSRQEITDIRPEREDNIDILFRFKVRNDAFVFRYPSKESAEITNYALEHSHNMAAKECGADESFIFEDRRGYRISLATKVADADPAKCVEVLKKIKTDGASVAHSFDYREKIRSLFEFFDDNQMLRASHFDDLRGRIASLMTLVENDNWSKQFSHNNISAKKFREYGSNICLVDWNFSGITDIGYDIAAIAGAFSDNLDEDIIKQFVELTPAVKRHLFACQAIASYYRFLLGIYYSGNENEFSNELYSNWKKACEFTANAEDLYSQKHNEYLTNDQVKYIEQKIGEPFISLTPLTGGVTNTTYEMIAQSGKRYAVRIPGVGTNAYINRNDEMMNIATIDSLGIMPKVICADPNTGILIMEYIENNQPCSMEDVYNARSLQRICRVLNEVHTSEKQFINEFDIPLSQAMYREHLKSIGGKSPAALKAEEERMDTWMNYLFLNYPKELVTCHIDPKLNNFLKKGMQLYLLDWEYSGMADLYFELANFSLTNNLTEEEEKLFLDMYCQVSGIKFDRVKFLLYKFATDYLWIYWHLIKCQQKAMVEYNEMSWKKRLKRAQKILDELEKESV